MSNPHPASPLSGGGVEPTLTLGNFVLYCPAFCIYAVVPLLGEGAEQSTKQLAPPPGKGEAGWGS